MNNTSVTILVAEDEKIIALDIKKTLQQLGYNVLATVTNVHDVLSFLENKKPDLILLDIMLKGTLSGIDAAKIIMEKYEIPFIYLTALTDEETLKKAKITEPFGYIVKPFNERGLRTNIEMALYKYKTENELKIKTKELEIERTKTEQLLHNILPADIVKELKETGNAKPRLYNQISILFAEFLGFSEMIFDHSPEILVEELDSICRHFDSIIEKYGLEKMKTFGDMYMAAGGLPVESEGHASKVVCAALEMIDFINNKNKNSEIKFNIRCGINSGEVIAGIVGSNKFTYDIWGDTVNIASRIGSSSQSGKINISGSTYELIKNDFDCEYRGKHNAKGKGEIDMYFVLGPKQNGEEPLCMPKEQHQSAD